MPNLQKIKVLAKERGIALNWLAEQVGISNQGLHIAIKENKTSFDTLEKVVSILDVHPGIFFDSTASLNVEETGVAAPEESYNNSNHLSKKMETLQAQINLYEQMVSDQRERIAELKDQIDYLKRNPQRGNQIDQETA